MTATIHHTIVNEEITDFFKGHFVLDLWLIIFKIVYFQIETDNT